MIRTLPVAAGLALAALALPAAAAAAPLVPAPGATNVAFAGGWTAWSAPAPGGRSKLVVRAPSGAVSDAAVPTFGAPVDPAIGSTSFAADGRRLLAVYARCAGTSALAGCDLYAYDLQARTERRMTALSTAAASETAPALAYGTWSFVRRGGPRPGVYTQTRSGGVRRISPRVARETATTGSRVAFTYASGGRGGVAVRAVSGRGPVYVPVSGLPQVPRSVQLTRYQVAWLTGEQLFSTTRFAGSGGPFSPRVVAGATVPGITSFAVGQSLSVNRRTDAAGVQAGGRALFTP